MELGPESELNCIENRIKYAGKQVSGSKLNFRITYLEMNCLKENNQISSVICMHSKISFKEPSNSDIVDLFSFQSLQSITF